MTTTKPELHPQNKHRELYDFNALIKTCPDLASFVKPNKYNNLSIDFFNPQAVKMLNKALLKHYYEINYWDIPQNYLCPPIPGRADYIHHIAEFLNSDENIFKKTAAGAKVKCLDIGVGANCVYPIIGSHEYDWTFVGSDIDAVAIQSAKKIIENNPSLHGKVELRLQENAAHIFTGIIQPNELFDLSICNPPFHSSAEEAQKSSGRKLRNLKQEKQPEKMLNFGGQNNELWYPGGEIKFIEQMILESKQFEKSCTWFSTLVSKESNLTHIYKALENIKAKAVKTIPMGQGNKNSRIVVWTFFNVDK